VPPCPKPLAAFSLVDNWQEVFTVRTRPGEFAVFDGMKAISAAWVVCYHVLLWQIYFVQNPEVRVCIYIERDVNMCVCVCVFVFVSGGWWGGAVWFSSRCPLLSPPPTPYTTPYMIPSKPRISTLDTYITPVHPPTHTHIIPPHIIPQYLVPPKGLLAQAWATPFFNYSGTLRRVVSKGGGG
jgi:hypothetical protein